MGQPSANRKIQCVIYDCDGVLFDSLEANRKLYNDLAISIGRSPLQDEEVNYVHSHTVFESIHFIFRDDEVSEKKALERLKGIDFKDYIVYMKMEPHLLEALSRLKEGGVRRAINTNRTTSMPYIMERFGLWPYFDMVVTALDVKHPKPHPESIEKILTALNLNKDETLFVGDSEVDRQTAESCGVRFIAYKNREIVENIFIDDHLELMHYISEDGR
ncbi:MAG: HAD family hydrolase [Desulfobacterales bacterium]|nr:HAD family hydrolase [Desulfobacterales bacterium]